MLEWNDFKILFKRTPQEMASDACSDTWLGRRFAIIPTRKHGEIGRNQLPFRQPPPPGYVGDILI